MAWLRGFVAAQRQRFTDQAAAEHEHANDEDHAHEHGDSGPDLVGEFVLERDDRERADGRPEQRAQAAEQVISATSPDLCQCASVSEASWNTSDFMPPATPARKADNTKASSL